MERHELADAHEPLGMLQRGRGAGYLAAIALPREAVWPMLVKCITDDPRWDTEVEDRDDYYAGIALATGMDLAPLARHLRDNDDRDQTGNITTLTVGTLGAMARRGHAHAKDILLEYVSCGNWWDWAVEELHSAGGADYGAIADRIMAHFSKDADLRDALSGHPIDEEPWQSIAASGRLGQEGCEALRATQSRWAASGGQWWRRIRPDAESADDLADMTVEELLAAADIGLNWRLAPMVEDRVTAADEPVLIEALGSGQQWRSALALRGLGRLATPHAFDTIKDFLCTHSEMEIRGAVLGAAGKAFIAIPASLCLQTGRDWFNSDRWWLRRLAEGILQHHATPDDVTLMRATVKEAADTEDLYRLSSMLEGLARFPNLGPLAEVETVFVELQYSYARARAATTLSVTAPERFLDTFAIECMWDCEVKTRELGCRTAALESPIAQDRLREIAADGFEEDQVKAAAQGRFQGHG